jgi:hypothetical protein
VASRLPSREEAVEAEAGGQQAFFFPILHAEDPAGAADFEQHSICAERDGLGDAFTFTKRVQQASFGQ